MKYTTLLCAALAAPTAMGQTVLVKQGDVLGTGLTVRSIRTVSAAGTDQVAALVETESGVAAIWRSGGSYSAVRVPSTVTGLQQAKFDDHFGVASNGSVVYSAALADGPVGLEPCPGQPPRTPGVDRPGFPDSIWLGDSPLSLEGSGIPSVSGWSFAGLSHAGQTWAGLPFWIAGETQTAWQPATSVGLYIGVGTQVRRLFGSGTPIGTSGNTIAGIAGIARVDFSPTGGRVIAILRTSASGGTSTDAVVASTTGAVSLQVLLERGEFVPGSWEIWKSFSKVCITDPEMCSAAPSWYAAGMTDGDPGHRAFVIRNGFVLYQEGMALDGQVLVGEPLALEANSSGDVAVLWRAGSSQRPALFVNGSLKLKNGDEVSVNGGGTGEVVHLGSSIAIGAPGVSNQIPVFVSAVVNISGVPKAALLRLTVLTTGTQECNGDVNCDMALDGFDVEVMERAVGGDMTDFCLPDPDVNCDYMLDGFDVLYITELVSTGC